MTYLPVVSRPEATMRVEEEYLKNILISVVENLHMKKWHYKIRNHSKIIVNYVGNFLSVTLTDEDTDKEVELLIKLAPSDPDLEHLIEILYRTEVCVYNILIPMFKSLNTDVNFDELIPDCYYADARKVKRVLVLKDISVQGFERYSKGEYLDCQHIAVSLRTIAQFHALSFILFKKKINSPEMMYLKSFTDNYPKDIKDTLEYFMGNHIHVFENSCYGGYLRRWYEKFCQNDLNYSRKVKAKVYGHGDFWKENILFKYEKDTPVAASLVDYQLTCLLSPAQDILSLIMTGTDSITRKKHFKYFISTYYNSLRDTLVRNGVDSSVYTEDDLRYDLRVVFPYCIVLSFFSFSFWLGLESLTSLSTHQKKLIPPKERETLERKLRGTIENLISDFDSLGFI